MSREIKFRTWDGTKMIPLKLFQGAHYKDDFVLRDQDEEGGYIDDKLIYPNRPIMQYTGLKDKNGVEIYEGDILKSNSNNLGVVKFERGSFTWLGDPIAWDEDYMTQTSDPRDWAIAIGNIHQNPELINKP